MTFPEFAVNQGEYLIAPETEKQRKIPSVTLEFGAKKLIFLSEIEPSDKFKSTHLTGELKTWDAYLLGSTPVEFAGNYKSQDMGIVLVNRKSDPIPLDTLTLDQQLQLVTICGSDILSFLLEYPFFETKEDSEGQQVFSDSPETYFVLPGSFAYGIWEIKDDKWTRIERPDILPFFKTSEPPLSSKEIESCGRIQLVKD